MIRGGFSPEGFSPDHLKGFQPLLNIGRCGESNLRIKDKRRARKKYKKAHFMYFFLTCVLNVKR